MPAQKIRIVVADDDPQLLRLLTRTLELEGYEVLAARDGEVALEQIEANSPNLILLDILMPKVDGFQVCQRVREFSAVPIIFVTARGHDQDKIRGLDLGADDYLSKPFNMEELLARVRAVLRRVGVTFFEPANTTPLMIGDLTVDETQHLVTMAGREVVLTPIEYHLLVYLVHHADVIIPQDRLLEHVWGKEHVGESHLLQVNINRLRRKLEPDPTQPRYILTKTGVGYLFTSP